MRGSSFSIFIRPLVYYPVSLCSFGLSRIDCERAYAPDRAPPFRIEGCISRGRDNIVGNALGAHIAFERFEIWRVRDAAQHSHAAARLVRDGTFQREEISRTRNVGWHATECDKAGGVVDVERVGGLTGHREAGLSLCRALEKGASVANSGATRLP